MPAIAHLRGQSHRSKEWLPALLDNPKYDNVSSNRSLHQFQQEQR